MSAQAPRAHPGDHPPVLVMVEAARDRWIALCARYRADAISLLETKNSNGAWLQVGFSVECCLKAAIMKKERFNRWPSRQAEPNLWVHDLEILFRRPGIDPKEFDHANPVAPALKTVPEWRRDHGYSLAKLPWKHARDICEAAFGGNGVVEWIANLYRLNI